MTTADPRATYAQYAAGIRRSSEARMEPPESSPGTYMAPTFTLPWGTEPEDPEVEAGATRLIEEFDRERGQR